MTNTIFGETPYPIRSDLDQATRKAWEYLGQPGNWWTGSERAAFVAENRAARDCRLCADRVEADAVQKSLGEAGVIGAAAIISTFQRMVRIADGTGIPLDNGLDLLSADLRDEIGINGFASAEGRGRGRLAAPLMRLRSKS